MWRYVAVDHPGLWCVIAVGVFGSVSHLPVNGWNVEILIARNLLRAHGFVVGPLDPPALWRPPLAVLVLTPIEMLVQRPETIYLVYSTLCLTASAVILFYLMKRVAGLPAAHLSQLLFLMTPEFNTLVNSQLQLMAYMAMFVTVLLALLVTMAQWSRPSLRGDVLTGLAWGGAFLARPEMSLFYAVTLFCSAVVYRGRPRTAGARWQGLATQAATFGVIYLATMATFSYHQSRHQLLGQVPLITFYAGEYFASGTPAVDMDGDGYAASVERFGAPAIYDNSLLRFTLAQPGAVLTRIRQNIGHTFRILSGHLVRWTDWVLFVLLASGMAYSRRPPISGGILALYGVLLTGASCYFLIFHPDSRYMSALVLMLLCVTLVASSQVWRWMAKGRTVTRSASLVISVSTAVMAAVCSMRVLAAVEAAPARAVDTTPFRLLAERFRSEHGAGGTPALGFSPADSDATLWISYYADSAIPWGGSAHFPRDRIYSFTQRDEDYSLMPASTDLAAIGNPPVQWRLLVPGFGEYMCLARR